MPLSSVRYWFLFRALLKRGKGNGEEEEEEEAEEEEEEEGRNVKH